MSVLTQQNQIYGTAAPAVPTEAVTCPDPVPGPVIVPRTENTFTEQVPPSGWQRKPGHRAGCRRCSWSSGRYDRLATAELVADNHERRGCMLG